MHTTMNTVELTVQFKNKYSEAGSAYFFIVFFVKIQNLSSSHSFHACNQVKWMIKVVFLYMG